MIWYQSFPGWLQSLFPSLLWRKKENEKTIYLTFDDGPHPEISLWVAELLKKHQLPATFFCVGDNARKYPETLNYLRNEGHSIGNHTMHHIKGWSNSTSDYLKDIELCQAYTGTQLFRPPYGRIKPSQVKALKKDFQIVMWSLLSCDFDPNLNTQKALEGLKRKTKDGSIVVFHDSVKAEKNLKILLPDYIDFLIKQGYKCKAL